MCDAMKAGGGRGGKDGQGLRSTEGNKGRVAGT